MFGVEEPSRPEDVLPVAQPVSWPAALVGEARPVSQPGQGTPRTGAMHLPGVRAAAVWQDLGFFVAAMVLGSLLLGVVGRLVLALGPDIDERTLKAGLIPFVAALSIGVVAGILKARGQSARSVGLTADRLLLNALLGLVALAAAFGAFYLFIAILLVAEPQIIELMQENSQAITQMLPRLHPVLLVGLMAVVGFYEELIFRGFLLTRLRRVSGSWLIAVMVSSLVFAVPHAAEQQPVAVLPLFGLGVTFSLFTIWRKSLLPAMLSHALFNSAQLLYLYYRYPEWT